jgi:glycosyltransferase involved in cell wall biosynthesis
MTVIFRKKFCSHFADPILKSTPLGAMIKEYLSFAAWRSCIKLSSCVMVISTGMDRIINDIVPGAPTILIPLLVTNNQNGALTDNIQEILQKIGLSRDEKIVMYSGKFTQSSGISDLIKVVELSLDTGKQWKLVITGPHFKKSKRHIDVPQVIKDRGLTDRIVYAGYLEKKAYKALINKADVLVVPKTTADINDYNFPGKLAEFMLTGNPVVAAKIGDIPLYIENNRDALLYKTGDIKALKEKISYLVANHDSATIIGDNGKKAAIDNFGNVQIMKKLYKRFNSVI